MVACLLFEDIKIYSSKFSFIQGTILLYILIIISNKNKLLVYLYYKFELFFGTFLLVH